MRERFDTDPTTAGYRRKDNETNNMKVVLNYAINDVRSPSTEHKDCFVYDINKAYYPDIVGENVNKE